MPPVKSRAMIARRLSVLVMAALVAAPLSALASPPAGAEKWALIVGIDRFQGRTRPNVGAVGDAADFKEMLLRHGWKPDHILVLTDGAATRQGIRDGLRWLRDRSTDRSYAVFHYSGHVKQTGGHEYLWPHDNAFIADTELGDNLRAVRGWLWADISGCEAAGFNEGIAAPKRLFTASSQANEKSYEHPEWRNSVYTGLLADRAVLQRQGDYDGNGRVSVTEAFRFAAEHAPQVTAGQRKGAQHPYAAGGNGTEWFLDPPAPQQSRPPAPTPGRTCNPICIEL